MPQNRKPRIGAKVNTSHPLSRGLVGYWLFNESGGNKVWDIFGKRYDGSMTNTDPSAAWVAAPGGMCLKLDGTNDYVDCGSGLSNRLQTVYSVWARVYFTSDAGIQPIVSLNVSGSSANGPINLAARYGTLVFRVNDSAFGIEEATVSSFAINTWYNIVGVRSGNNLRLYVNTVPGTDSTTAIPAFGSVTQQLRFGNNAYESSDYFNGLIDRVAIWERALTSEDVFLLSYARDVNLLYPRPPQEWVYSGTNVSVSVSVGAQTLTTATNALSFVTDQILSIGTNSASFNIPAISFSLDQILAQSSNNLAFTLNAPSVSIAVTTTAGVQVGTLSTNAISYLTDQILSIGAQSNSFTIPAVTVLAGGDVLITLTSPVALAAALNTPGVVTDAVLDINTSTLVLVLNPSNVTISTPSTAKVSSMYIVLGIR